MQKKYKSHKGLAEKTIRKKLEKQGWTIWKGGYLYAIRFEDLYPNVYRKYLKLNFLLKDRLEYLQYLCVVHHGMPDFLCYRKGIFKFVECKLGHEQLSNIQKKCIITLQSIGYKVEVHKLVFNCTKARTAYVNIKNGNKIIKDKQSRLKLKYKKNL